MNKSIIWKKEFSLNFLFRSLWYIIGINKFTSNCISIKLISFLTYQYQYFTRYNNFACIQERYDVLKSTRNPFVYSSHAGHFSRRIRDTKKSIVIGIRDHRARGNLDTPGVHAPADGVIEQPTRQQIIANDLPVPLQLPCLIPT